MSEELIPVETTEDLRNLAEADLYKAQAEEAAAHAREFNAKARRSELMADKLEREARFSAALNNRNFVYHFETAVRDTQTARETFDAWHRLDGTADWTIIMNSPGGSVIDGMALFDQLDQHSLRGGGTHHITIIVRGYAASMGGILLQAADKRVCGKNSLVLIHKISAGTGGSLDDMEDDLKFFKMLNERIVQLFVERCGGKLTKAHIEKRWTRKDWWLPAEEALELGVIDAIG